MKGVIHADERGKHKNNPFKIPSSHVQAVLDHIDSFPVMESHYCRAESKREYLEEGLTISRMYKMYKEDIGEPGGLNVSEYMYRHIFNTERNLGFFIPKKDRYAFFGQQIPTCNRITETRRLTINLP